MARPRKFEREPLLDQAREVFWAKGYEAASVHDLVVALDIHPGSLYATFGDKHRLYLEVLDRYQTAAEKWFEQLLQRPGSRKEALANFFSTLVEALLSPGGRRGCLLTNATMERALCDEQVGARAGRHNAWLEEAFHRTLQQAQAAGEIPLRSPDELRALAQFLTSNLQGLRVMARTATPPQVLRDIARLAVQAIG